MYLTMHVCILIFPGSVLYYKETTCDYIIDLVLLRDPKHAQNWMKLHDMHLSSVFKICITTVY